MHTKRDPNGGDALIRAVLLIAAGALLACGVGWLGDAEAKHAPARTSTTTHLGQRASDLVVLQLEDAETESPFFVRAHPDGSVDTTEFQTPDGQVLIVTDVEWAGDLTGIGSAATMRLFVEDRTDSDQRALVLLNSYVTPVGSSSRLGSGATPTTGFVVPHTARLLADIVPMQEPLRVPYQRFSNGSRKTGIIVRGYLTRDE